MSLWFSLMMNTQKLGVMEIMRVTNRDVPVLDPQTVSIYEVRVDGKPIGRLEHRYGAGAWALVSSAATLVSVAGPGDRGWGLGDSGSLDSVEQHVIDLQARSRQRSLAERREGARRLMRALTGSLDATLSDERADAILAEFDDLRGEDGG